MKNKHYTTDTDVDTMLNDMERDGMVFEDLTFIYTPFGTGWRTRVIDNNSIDDKEVKIDELSKAANDFHIRQLIDLTKQKYGLTKTA